MFLDQQRYGRNRVRVTILAQTCRTTSGNGLRYVRMVKCSSAACRTTAVSRIACDRQSYSGGLVGVAIDEASCQVRLSNLAIN